MESAPRFGKGPSRSRPRCVAPLCPCAAPARRAFSKVASRLRAAHVLGRNSFLAPAVCDFAMILLGFRKCQMRRQRISASPVAQNAIPVLFCLISLGSLPGCAKRVDVASRTFARCNSIALRARRMLRTPFPCVSSAPNVLTSHFVLSRDATVSHFVLFDCSELHSRAFQMPCSRA